MSIQFGFFVIVEAGQKDRYIDRLDWLEETYPLAYAFKNSDVGCKILFEDGIYGEYAIFEERELTDAAYTEGRVVWKNPLYNNTAIAKPRRPLPSQKCDSLDFPLNEALTNLYVGLGRYARESVCRLSGLFRGMRSTGFCRCFICWSRRWIIFQIPLGMSAV